MMCEFEYIYPGEIVTFNITDPCRSCGVISNAIRTLRYEGHITNGIVYDLFIDIEGGLTCPSCGTSWTGWAKPCWSGGSWDIAELTQVVTGDSLGAAALSFHEVRNVYRTKPKNKQVYVGTKRARQFLVRARR